ncbi:MAG: AAA family ATPase [Acidobacteria bacterium]|nr:AAA family ATPase [Acidobacteriota bacterium]
MAGIRSITVAGFKSIRRAQTIELRPLTILAGANNSGKSSIMQPLLLLKQTLEAPFDPGPLRLDGPNVPIDSVNEVLHCGAGKPVGRFSVEVALANYDACSLEFRGSSRKGIEIAAMIARNARGMDARVSPAMTGQALHRVLKADVARRTRDRGIRWSVVRQRCFLNLEAQPANGLAWLVWDGAIVAANVGSQIERMLHVPGSRPKPARVHGIGAVGDKFPGAFTDYVAGVIDRWQGVRPDKLRELGEGMARLALTSRVEARRVGGSGVEILVAASPQGLLNLANVGLGVSQALPAMVALLTAEADDLVYLEEPEIHLHPRAQSAMASVLADAARRGVIVVAETHSSLLLRGVQTLVAKGELKPELVKLHWFQRRAPDGCTRVHSTDLDDKGAFGDWPEDFDDVSWDAAREYLDAVESASVR